MGAIEQLATRLASINIFETIDVLFGTPKYQKMLPVMVKRRLILSGQYSTGEKITTYIADRQGLGNVYSTFTIGKKKESGMPSTHVTLAETGAFHRSFNLMPKQTFAVIAYDEIKPDGVVSDNVDLNNVFNLSEVEMNTLRSQVLPDLIRSIKTQLNA